MGTNSRQAEPALEMTENLGDWEQRFCATTWCQAKTLYVQRSSKNDELWQVTVDGDTQAFQVAATAPICPLCGGNLMTGANLIEGMGQARK